jgi:hypothetical protein
VSVTTHPGSFAQPVSRRPLAERHPQLAPFLVAFAMFVIIGGAALLITGLPG